MLGLTDTFRINYVTPEGTDAVVTIPVYKPVKDSVEKSDSLKPEKYTQKERRSFRAFSTRHIQVDTSLNSAYMLLNTFSNGTNLRKFFKTSFKNIERLGIKHLVIDVRSNGGGEAGNSTLLTQYLTDHNFKIGDSLYAIKRSSKYRDYIKFQPMYWLIISSIITRKKMTEISTSVTTSDTFLSLSKNITSTEIFTSLPVEIHFLPQLCLHRS